MLEALWSVEFGSTQGYYGPGVVIFETGRIFGGDSSYYYLGRYKVKNGVLKGEVEFIHYNGRSSSFFGLMKQFCIIASGKVREPRMELEGCLADKPNQKMFIRFTKRADLP